MQVKGTAIVSTLNLIKKKWGEEVLKEILSELPENHRQALAFDGCVALWYPFELYIQLTESVINRFYNGNLEACRELGAYTAEHDTKVIVRLFYKLGTPQFIVRLGTWAFHRYFDEGEVRVVESYSGKVIFEISKMNQIHPMHYQRIAGWMNKAVELSGGQDVQTTVEVIDNGDYKTLRFVNLWK